MRFCSRGRMPFASQKQRGKLKTKGVSEGERTCASAGAGPSGRPCTGWVDPSPRAARTARASSVRAAPPASRGARAATTRPGASPSSAECAARQPHCRRRHVSKDNEKVLHVQLRGSCSTGRPSGKKRSNLRSPRVRCCHRAMRCYAVLPHMRSYAVLPRS